MKFLYTIAELKTTNAPQFVDYSHWQGKVNGDKLRNNNIRGAIVKAGEVWMNVSGKPAIKDNLHDWNINELKRAGLITGSYYYWHPKAGASKQYNHYWEISKNFKIDFPPILDVEEFDGYNSANKVEVERQLLAMIWGIEKLFKRKPIIYTRSNLWGSMLGNPDWGKDYLFWFAQYNLRMDYPNSKISNNVIIWQYTDRLNIPGLTKIDGDYWLKDEQALKDVIGNSYQPPISPTPNPNPNIPPFEYVKLKVICSALLGRSQPIYINSTKAIYFKNGQILDIVQPVEIVLNSGINFIKVKIPNTEKIYWVSSSPSYVKKIV